MVEEEGTPATALVTEPFQGLIAAASAKLGAPGYGVLIVPHPVWGKSREELRELAASIADQALALLTP
jgi:hypothetical protein